MQPRGELAPAVELVFDAADSDGDELDEHVDGTAGVELANGSE